MALADINPAIESPRGRGAPVRVITDTVTIRASAKETGDAYAVFDIETPPSGGFPPHIQHDEDEAYYVIEGTYAFLIGAREEVLGVGEFLIVPRGTLHGYVNPGSESARMLILTTPGHNKQLFFEEVGDSLDRPVWEPDMARFLAAAPNYGIDIPRADTSSPGP
jgi:mannose-6-phosphate isomerase-like protein (cupin superfamily)